MLAVKTSGECAFDEISLGEIMLRFDPGESRIKTARSFKVWEGGGEYNVARALKRCFNQRTAIATSLADNEIGRLIEDFVFQGGVDMSFVKWLPYDGIGRNVRNGLNFTERGFGVRGALGVSDRGNSAASKLKAGDIDFDYIFGTLGVRWFHTGGIFAALSETASEVVLEAVSSAKKYGTIVSYDLNYRASLWKDFGGLVKAQEVNKSIVPFVDVLMGNEEDFDACLGVGADGTDESYSELSSDSYGAMLLKLASLYPNLSIITSTLRTVRSATVNDWSAVCYAYGEIYSGMTFDSLEIFDRIGGGDSFASGLIAGILCGRDIFTALNIGIAHGALAMTTPGDTSMASLKEVEALINGKSKRVDR